MKYTFQTVTVPDANTGTWLEGINNAGEVAGYKSQTYTGASTDFSPYPKAFTYQNGTFTAVTGTSRDDQSAAHGVNNQGLVAGLAGSDPVGEYGFVAYPNGTSHKITSNPTANYGLWDQAYGINDHGQVVGTDFGNHQRHVGFLWNAGVLSTFQAPGAQATEGHGINNAGVIVGSADANGFMKVGSQFTTITVPGAQITNPMGINSDKTVVGSYEDSAQHWHGFISNGDNMSFIDKPGAYDTFVTGINDNGTIVGYTDDSPNGPATGFIGTDPNIALVRQDYIGLLGHDADQNGLNFWTKQLDAGALTKEDLANALLQSDEGKSLHDHQSGKQYINSLFENALGRPADHDTKVAWAGALHSGLTRGDALSAIANSPEAQMHFAAAHG